MSLPWFSFYTDDYIRNTMHLTTEEHGAYLLLMLAYYGTEKPLPSSDRALAALSKLPMDRWMECRPAIAAFFVEEGALWRHHRIEEEIAERCAKHAQSSARASHAASVKAAKLRSERAPSRPKSSPKATQLQEHSLITREREAAAPEGSLSEGQKGLSGKEGQEGQHSIVPKPQPPAAPNPLGTQLPEDWVPSDADIATAEAYGMGAADLEQEVLKFHAKHAGEGTFSKNWPATWQLWCARFKEYHVKNPPKARIEVNSGPYVPTTKDWTAGVLAWARDNGTWPYRKLGPEPGLIGCKCPPEIIRAAGFDPATGLKLERAPS